MKKLVICIFAYNEERSIGSLIQKLMAEQLEFDLFVYTDGSSDTTPEIVLSYQAKYQQRLTHIKGEKNIGKRFAFNSMLDRIREYEVALFLDADVHPETDAIKALYEHFLSEELVAACPLLVPYVTGLHAFERTMANLYLKARLHAATYKRHKYLSGRAYCIRTSFLRPIPAGCPLEDMYLSLMVPYDSLDVCTEAVIYYRRPSTIVDFIHYNLRLGRGMGIIKKNFAQLWVEQMKRSTLVDNALFDLTRYKFRAFLRTLSFFEMLVFCFSRALATLSMYYGFYGPKSERTNWRRIDSTKIAFTEE